MSKLDQALIIRNAFSEWMSSQGLSEDTDWKSKLEEIDNEIKTLSE